MMNTISVTEVPKCCGRSALVLLLCGLSIVSETHGQNDATRENHEDKCTDQTKWAVVRTDGALSAARTHIGLSNIEGAPNMTAHLTTVETDETPYLSNQIVGRALWHVVVSNWSITLKPEEMDVKDPYNRTFDVLLDPETGGVLRIRSRWPENEARIGAEPTAATATRQLERAHEIYHAFPTVSPKVTFLDALNNMYRKGIDPRLAKQISGVYVVRSILSEKPKAVWAITMRGVPPFKAPSHWPADAQYEYRAIVDAETGQFESLSNRPRSPEFAPPPYRQPKDGD